MSSTLSGVGTVVLVGAGKMGMALAGGWLESGLQAEKLVLVDPTPGDATLAFASKHGLRIAERVDIEPSVLVLAVKPQIIQSVFEQVKPAIGEKTLVVSVVAAISIERMSAGLGTNRIVRTMPGARVSQ